MKRMHRTTSSSRLSVRRVGALLPAAVLLATACRPAPPAADPAYVAEVTQWRQERLQRLEAPDGWLSLVGLHWLHQGPNRLGSAEAADVPMPADQSPAEAATLTLRDDGTVWLDPGEGSGLEVNGEPAAAQVLATDADGEPDVLTLGRLRFYLIARGDRVGVRVKDPEAPTRTGFAGIDHYPIDPAWKVTARLEPYDELREVAVPTVLGTDETMVAPGLLHFTADGQDATLVPLVSGPDDDAYFLIFRDATSGDTTYGAGRFLSAEAVGEDGTTTIDFNLAYNPPCAFTPYATCPLPPKGNTLLFPIEAGEKYSGPAH